MTIQPTAVYPPNRSPATQQRFYQTYNTRYVPNDGGYTPPSPPPRQAPQAPGFNYGGSRLHMAFQRIPGGGQRVTVPSGVPGFLGGRSIILFSWIAAMAMVSLDEWHTHHVLPRPARLWYTSLTYFLLALAGTIDVMVPLVNMLAIGLTISVAYNYYNGVHGFGNYGKLEGEGVPPVSATSGAGNTTAGGGGGGGGFKEV